MVRGNGLASEAGIHNYESAPLKPTLLGWDFLLQDYAWNLEVWSGRLDLNQRPPAPKAGALPGCATPRLASIIAIRRWLPNGLAADGRFAERPL